MKSIGDRTDIVVTRMESNFDRACDEACRQAVLYFEIDEDGHSRRVKDWERSCCWIEIEFKRYVRRGNEHCYTFTATAAKDEDDWGNEEED